jgi:hypothetical protein
MPYAKHRACCPDCGGRRLIWMGGGDYLECPSCDATGEVTVIEERLGKMPPHVRVLREERAHELAVATRKD